MTFKHLLTILSLSIALTACGSDSDNNADGESGGTTDGASDGTTDGAADGTTDGAADGTTDGTADGTSDGSTDGSASTQLTGNVTNWGVIDLDEINNTVEPSAGFGRFNANFAAANLTTAFVPSQDVCEVSRTELFDFPTEIDFDFEVDFDLISAGDAITFTGPAGTYAELTRETFGQFTGYSIENPLTGPAPSGLVVDIPGDEFPAFSNIAIPDVTALQVTAPAPNTPVTPSTQFSWVAATGSDTVVGISTNFIDIATSENVSVDCTVADDGSFAFDSATRSAMGSVFSSTGLFLSRSAFTFRQNGNTVLIVSHTIEN